MSLVRMHVCLLGMDSNADMSIAVCFHALTAYAHIHNT